MLTTDSARTISAVVPAYGVELYLADCLDSLLRVSSLHEIVVVIDHSPDNCAYIAHQYARSDPRVVVIENAQNLGLGASRNVGLDVATGEYVIFVDSDDLVVPAGIDAMAASLERSGSDFVTACADEFGRTPARVRYWTTRAPVFRRGAVGTHVSLEPELIEDHTAWTKLFRRSFLVEHAIRWPEATKCEDVAASTRAYVLAQSVDVVPVVSYLYRRRPGSITTGLSAARTVGDWGRQTMDALRFAEGVPNPNVLQVLIRKVLDVEARYRIEALAGLPLGPERKAAEEAIRLAAGNATVETLCSLRVDVVKAALELFRDVGDLPHSMAKAASRFGLGVDDLSLDSVASLESLARWEESGPRGTPELSIVMPTHNVATYVGDTIRSILGQTYTDFELIIVDDASEDETWQVISAWAKSDSRVRVYRNKGVGGAQARNFGIEQAVGTFITFADGDDLLPTRAYQAMTDAMRRYGSEMTVGDFQKFWPTSVWRNSSAWGVDSLAESTTLLAEPRLITNRTCWNRMFRLDFWRREKLHFPSTPRANDILPMTSAMARARRISTIPDVVYHYRARPGSGSMTAALSQASSVSAYFRQELLCAGVIDGGLPSAISAHYWKASLGGDGWANLGVFLRNLEGSPDEEADSVSEAVQRLWRFMPTRARSDLTDRQQICYQLVAQGNFQAGRTLWMAESSPTWRRTREAAVDVLDAILELEGFDQLIDPVLRVFHDDVLRPLIDDTSEWTASVVEHIARSAVALAASVNLREAAVPETKEPRVLEALLSGCESNVWFETGFGNDAAPREITVHENGRGDLVLGLPGWSKNEPIVRLEWQEASRKSKEVGRLPLTLEGPRPLLPAHPITVPLSTLEPLRGRRWKIAAVIHDNLGERKTALRIVGSTARRSSSVRQDGNSLYMLYSGFERVSRALSWRVRRARAKYSANGRTK